MSNYPEYMVAPMREELVQVGFRQLLTPAQVDEALQQPGTTLLLVNSVCGCAAAGARPGVTEALRTQGLRFDHLVTVFAGMEKEATAQAREYFEGAMPTSPQAAIFKDGQLVHLMQRQDFLGHEPGDIAASLVAAYRRTVAAS
ncbi:MAG TPA: BrxA/BrxB family bacilliredoxin [Geothrix sp.]|nr:BrxA/BrxB family bacilliredoxin [Holophagaceae bacterium]HJV38934.1 BrxA/BrxB family bacilliredoxin [Geothrix sp.]